MFKNPNFVDPGASRLVKYEPFVNEFLASLPAGQPGFTFDDIRAWARQHPDAIINTRVDDMTDGLLDDLCQRVGLKRV